MKSGFVAIVGRPNVGKSTLLNNILKQKISIVANKSQTTRNNIKGIYQGENAQIVFVDTPGIHKPKVKLSKELDKMAYSALEEVDAVILVVDGSVNFGPGDEFLLTHLKIEAPLFIVINKIDETNVVLATKLKEIYKERMPEAQIIETVATKGFNVDELINRIIDVLPEGPAYYEVDDVTDQDEIFRIKEIIREKALRVLKEEVPHSIAVYMNNIEWEEDPIHIRASIIVEKESQKAIVIGANGKKIKDIGIKARKDIEDLLKKHVYLELYVKVEKDWRNEESSLKKFGYKTEKK